MTRMIFLLLMLPVGLFAYDDTPRCYKELERGFYDYSVVVQALSLYQVPQSGWDNVYNSIQSRSRDIPATVKNKAKRMKPNPFQNPFNKQEASKLLNDALYDVLVQSLKENDVASPLYAHDMFQYIKERQKQKWDECFGEEK